MPDDDGNKAEAGKEPAPARDCIVKHLKNRNGVASPCRTTCTVCGDAPCYAFLSIQLYVPAGAVAGLTTAWLMGAEAEAA